MAHALAHVILLGLAWSSAALAAEPLQQSPIAPGFWTWPREKLASPDQIAESCRAKFAVQFADGRYFGVKMRANEKVLTPPVIDEVGQCRFNREAQLERCELRAPQTDGSVIAGV